MDRCDCGRAEKVKTGVEGTRGTNRQIRLDTGSCKLAVMTIARVSRPRKAC